MIRMMDGTEIHVESLRYQLELGMQLALAEADPHYLQLFTDRLARLEQLHPVARGVVH